MSTSLLWISTFFCCLNLIQGHSADIQHLKEDNIEGIVKEDNIEGIVKEDTKEGICMKKAGGDQKQAQCETKLNQLTKDETVGSGELFKSVEKVEKGEEEANGPLENLTVDIPPTVIPSLPPPSPKLDKLPDVEVLLDEEEKMLNFVRDYVENETLRLEQLNKNLVHWITISNYSMADPQDYLSVYLNCFHLLKRMAFDIPNDILNLSLYDTSLREEDLDQWDLYSEDHHLVSFLNSSPQKLELLDSFDAYGLLSLLNSNSELSVPETKLIDILSNSLVHRPFEFEELSTEDMLLDKLLEYVNKLDQKNQTESSKLLIKSAKLKYPLSEKLATV